jgi:hypothetical protein
MCFHLGIARFPPFNHFPFLFEFIACILNIMCVHMCYDYKNVMCCKRSVARVGKWEAKDDDIVKCSM